MSTIRFSVVIPTRERAETLQYALRTCLDQEFDNYEIIVSDNCSSPATKAVVDAIASPKVRYVRTAEPLAMSNNWEFGVSHTRGDYVIVIGDDDGLLPHALRELDRLARDYGSKAIRWTAAYYTWPTVALPGQGDYLRLPMSCELHECNGDELIREVAEFRTFYTDLPMLYNAAVHRDVLNELRQRTGRVFPHHIPDVYSGFAVAHVAGRFLSTSVPMTVSGQSGASNGIATLFNRNRSGIDREFHALNMKDGLRPDPTVPDLPVFPHVPVADSFVFAKRVLFPNASVSLDRWTLAMACVTGARVTKDEWPAALAAIRESLADLPELQQLFAIEFDNAPYQPPPPMPLRPPQMGFTGEDLQLDAAQFGVKDIAGAALLCEHVLNYRGRMIAYVMLQEREIAVRKIVNRELQSAVSSLQTTCKELVRQLRAERRWSIKRPVRVAKRALAKMGLRVF
jgi:hypothetical protein